MKRVFWAMALSILAMGNALAAGGLADVTIYDRVERHVLPVYWHDGKAFVVGKPGNEYQIMLKNREGGDVLAVVSVDGVNVVTGETAAASQSGYVIDTWGSLDIKGWRKSLARTAAFYFTSLPDSYAARTGRPDDVGVIGVALFRRKVEEPPVSILPAPYSSPRKAESTSQAGSSADTGREAPGAPRAQEQAENSLGTGHGRNETSHARYVDFVRATTSPEEVITIYYDSRANLAARGVIEPEPWREPRPFPARFVADPPRRW